MEAMLNGMLYLYLILIQNIHGNGIIQSDIREGQAVELLDEMMEGLTGLNAF